MHYFFFRVKPSFPNQMLKEVLENEEDSFIIII